jgi:hypothetical protein
MKKRSMFSVQLLFVIFGCAFGATLVNKPREAPPQMTNDN